MERRYIIHSYVVPHRAYRAAKSYLSGWMQNKNTPIRYRRNGKRTRAHAQVLFLSISGYLSSRGVSPQVRSAFAGLTAVFGMGTGGPLQPSPLNLQSPVP